MLRHAIFALVLVGAAFAGGAAINGPGMAWVQRNVLGGPLVVVDGEPSASPSGRSAASSRKDNARPAREFPTADAPPLKVIMPAAPAEAPSLTPAGLDPASGLMTPEAGLAAAPVEGSMPPLDLPGDPLSAPAPLAAISGPSPGPASVDGPGPLASPSMPDLAPPSPFQPPSQDQPQAKADPAGRLASASMPDSSAAGAPRADWSEIRSRLRAAGVSRYSIEGEPGGRVRFSCVVPVDGLKAVGHHFEAEADDEPAAAEATLRRIALWRATEGR